MEHWRRKAIHFHRLSKFQPLMPDWVERELMAGYFLDVEGARGWLANVERPAPVAQLLAPTITTREG